MDDQRDEDSFEQRLAAAQEKAATGGLRPNPSTVSDMGSASSIATRVIAEMLIPIALAVGLGWWLDRVLGCAPWLVILAVPLGMAAGIRGVLRSATSGKHTRE
jgi:ATP synthase protein I